ncbi:glycosyltransferase [Fictibacillus phosphorivorans]|uniref:glycosyltransferase n=1 Tax=Fictibacillus phosphorivorans TaxID=1221500 RepID=UPI00204259F4|nr:glycosyltransferase [Fictibacillus phosphorivorans]MCM3717685.1 glycosyltransferase [Fictibacillus phosphorivorans]MCM3775585.1 glycosyltransferase [Fictibacillus phosphorivorans]
MKVLFASPRLPYPPIKGDQLRAYNQLKGLKSLGHEVHLISFGTENSIPYELQQLCKEVTVVPFKKTEAVKNMFTGLFKGWPLQMSLYHSHEMHQALTKAASQYEFDIVHHQLVRLFPYHSSIRHLPNVIDFVDSISLNLNRTIHMKKSLANPILRWEARNVHKMEQLASYHYDAGVFISDVDKNNVSLNRNTLTSIANGVDLDYFSYQKQLTNHNNLIFVGNMSYAPNREGVKYFIHNIYPLIKERRKDFTFYIVGRNPTKDLLRLCEKYENIVVTGEVEDVREYLWKSKLFVCPLKMGAGLQNKVLEAMSCGTPVITTSIVNDPIGGKHGKNIVVCDQDKEFADAVVRLLADMPQLEGMRKEARSFVENNFQWKHLNEQLVELYRRTINNKRESQHLSNTKKRLV